MRRSRRAAQESFVEGRPWLPAATVLVASLLTIWPVIASVPVLPPFGLIMLLAWRLSDEEIFPIWAPLGFGLFDDLFSGQPLGSAMLLWTLCFLMTDLIDQRLPFRDFREDWLIAAGGLAFCLLAGRWIALPLGTHVDTVLLLQLGVSVLFYPLLARLVAFLAGEREEQ